MQLRYHTLDVFSDRPFGGNPLAVVHDGDELSLDQMQAIAREFNLSETVFVMRPQNPGHSARVRIFTPVKELTFAGHPTIGTAALLAELKSPALESERDSIIVLEERIGSVRVGVQLKPETPAFAEFDAPKRPIAAGDIPPVDTLAAALGLIPSEIGFENHKPICFAASDAFAFVPVAGLEVLHKARVNPGRWAAAFDEQGVLGTYLYTRQSISKSSSFHARMFAPSVGIPEDPATGSAAVCFAGLIALYDDLPDGIHKRLIEQGHVMKRPSLITLSLEVANGELASVRIGGHAVRMSEGIVSF